MKKIKTLMENELNEKKLLKPYIWKMGFECIKTINAFIYDC